MKRIGFMTRLTPENHKWLEGRAREEDRSMTYVLDRVVSHARESDQAKENAPEAATSDASMQ
ncbi:hypothetical protein C7440_1067 [Pusillimonas noertemannii]|uniref:Arc-like DNA binding dprotein n=1 Tax=Pusillimonas noertemannii TaxID=305977 RepID=A0A2U1CRY7_9BURK|nr:hypothetical protein C7440_1067 [Pusillimonas noertemannii]